MKRLIVIPVIGLLLATTACDKAASFRQAVPARQTIELRVPGASSGGQALTLGEQAPLYGETVKIAASVNGGVLWVFDVIDRILALPPTSVEDGTAVWGPSEPRGLERISYRFTVVEVEAGHYTYHLDARPKGEESEDAFVTVFEGEAFPGDDNDGTGTLTWHLGSLRSIAAAEECLTGEIEVAYDAASEPRILDVDFVEVANLCNGEVPTNAHYVYTANLDESGSMDFAIRGNIHKADESKPELEVLAVRSRWLTTGEGRSDVQVSEGEIPADLATYIPGTTATTVDIVECWDASFALVHADTTPDELEQHLGHPATGDAAQCVFAEAEFAQL